MWRAFFLAVGTMLIILGVECLVTDKFVISNETRLSGVFSRVLDRLQKPTSAPPNGQAGPYYAQAANQGSQFGPSRFGDNFSSQPTPGYYGGVPSQNGQTGNFRLAGYGTNPGYPPGSTPPAGAIGAPNQIFHTKDWMPWSLLAAGAIVVLYTNATTQRSYNNDA